MAGLAAILWFALPVQAAGLVARRVLRRVAPFPGHAGVAKVLGVLAFAYGPWLAASVGGPGFSRLSVLLSLVALLAVGLVFERRPAPVPRPEGERRAYRTTEIVFWGTFVVVLALRALGPEIAWGEKPTDFAILNTIDRSVRLPPADPWFAGSILHYTYFGHFVVAALGKVGNVDPAVSFNLGGALTAALAASAALAAGQALGGRLRVGLLAALFAVFAGNLSGLPELLARGRLDFDWFWATSRIVDGAINEYPFWSVVFADLHAHLLAMPFALTFLTLAIAWARWDDGTTRTVVMVPLAALALGAVTTTSAWSTPTYVLALPWLLLVGGRAARDARGRVVGVVRRVVLPALAVVLLAVVLFRPFWAHFRSPPRNWGFVRGDFVAFDDVLTVFGLFFFVWGSFLVVVRRDRGHRAVRALRATALGLGLVALLLGLDAVREIVPAWVQAAGPVRIGLALVAAVAAGDALSGAVPAVRRLIAGLGGFALLVCAGTDAVFVWDRMNTIFKYWLDAWLLLAPASAAAVFELTHGLLRDRTARRAWRVAFAALLALALVTSIAAVPAATRHGRAAGPRPTLDGLAHLKQSDRAVWEAYAWVDRHVAGLPVVAEAWGPAYRDYARVSMHTGLPTVLGWDFHVFQRAQARDAIERRKLDLVTLYTDPDPAAVRTVVERYHVALVWVGDVERRRYGVGFERFERMRGLFVPVYRNARVRIYAVRGRGVLSRADTAIWPVPPAAALPGPGIRSARLAEPRGLALDAAGRVYVADFGNDRVQVRGRDLALVRLWGSSGTGPGEFHDPAAIAIAGDGSVYVADTWNHRVQVFDAAGRYLRAWGEGLFGPRGIAVGPSGDVYLADTGNHRVRRFAPDGRELAAWGGQGAAPDRLDHPVGLAVDADERVWVADDGNARLQGFDASGRLVGGFPVAGWSTAPHSEPHVALDARGLVWVTVPLAGAVRAYTASGTLVEERRTLADGRPLGRPMGIAVDPADGTLVVSDLDGRLHRLAAPRESP